ncbi:unnamed protein product [Rotaria sp. Silwood2]|nr:unnamed protein product [Rotaria sp. Silwood2]CAF4628576.1 unnamed protein product [Rotaria sp. Silwood2]
MGQTDAVEKFARKFLSQISTCDKLTQVNILDRIKCHVHLGNVALERDQLKEALREYKIALTLAEDLEESNVKYAVIINAAIKHYTRALNVLEQQKDKDVMQLVNLYLNIAATYRDLKDYEQARKFCQQALTFQNEYFPDAHFHFAVSYKSLAAIYFDLHEFNQALEACQKALDIELRTLPFNHPNAAVTYENMAVIYERLNDIEHAQDCLHKANAIDHTATLIPYSRFSIIQYTCPWCRHTVWIYTIFKFVRGAPCFRCLRRMITFHRKTNHTV